jgi:hypothetical protein
VKFKHVVRMPRGERIAGAARRTEQFRGRYELRLSEARKLLGS